MYNLILNWLRRRKLRKFISDVPTGFVPMKDISRVNVVVDAEDTGVDALKDDIFEWGRKLGLKVNVFYFDFRKLSKDDQLITSIQTTILKKELSLIGVPSMEKTGSIVEEPSDLFISLINNGDYPIEFLGKCAKARFKIGRFGYAGDPYNMIFSSNNPVDLRTESRQLFATITDFLNKIQ